MSTKIYQYIHYYISIYTIQRDAYMSIKYISTYTSILAYMLYRVMLELDVLPSSHIM
jgi:hypothetical protein